MESISILERRFDLFPARFSWQGQVYEVDAVTECQTVTAITGQSEVYHFWVRCRNKQWRLSQDLASDRWMLQQD